MTETTVSRSATTPRWARKGTVVLLTVALALVVFGTTTQTWLNVTLDPSDVRVAPLKVAGSKAATAVTALALVSLAGALAASIAGRVARWIIAVMIVISAAGIVSAGATVLADPLSAAQSAIASATGIAEGNADVQTTVFPVIAMVAGVLLALSAVVLLLAGRHWKQNTRYKSAAAAAASGTGEGTNAEHEASEDLDEIDSWDSLSRGEDPT
ncbi:Trp biosynthesis-associated membrane protein [Pseudarthrobacter sp. J1738]|uniref:Trp biosynthesis-associated membrane protein n=1 Tax=Pseudarthrobacter sp. J1738 TaxID=3420446 RepID=UPI003D2B8F06